jgi:hypothetical protein
MEPVSLGGSVCLTRWECLSHSVGVSVPLDGSVYPPRWRECGFNCQRRTRFPSYDHLHVWRTLMRGSSHARSGPSPPPSAGRAPPCAYCQRSSMRMHRGQVRWKFALVWVSRL